MPLRVLIVIGTRPEAIKLAPVVAECRRRATLTPIVCLTGQHRELIEPLVAWFALRPDLDLRLMQPNQTPAALTARCLAAVDEVIGQQCPDVVVVQGDTSTVLATALAAFLARRPLVHVEAGLRTGNLAAPWPEEFNRRATTIATTIHAAPTQQAAENLLREGVPSSAVHVTGNTVIDALLWTTARQQTDDAAWRKPHAYLGDRPLVLITGHRRENQGRGLEQICSAISELAARFAEVEFVYPVHLNPNVRGPVHALLGSRANVHLIPPVDYPEFVWLMRRSTLIVSDSGGVQEEAPSLRRPVLVTRETTERPEGVDAGAVELVGADAARIVARVTCLLTDPAAYAAMQIDANPYGDGQAARRIVDLIETISSES